MMMARHAEAACAAKADGDVGENVDEAAMDACATTKNCLGILSTQGDEAVPPSLRQPPAPSPQLGVHDKFPYRGRTHFSAPASMVHNYVPNRIKRWHGKPTRLSAGRFRPRQELEQSEPVPRGLLPARTVGDEFRGHLGGAPRTIAGRPHRERRAERLGCSAIDKYALLELLRPANSLKIGKSEKTLKIRAVLEY
jgi:hypothetical protein